MRLRGTNASNNEENKDSGSTGKLGFFEKFETSGSPFDYQPEDDESEDVLEVNGVSGGRPMLGRVILCYARCWKAVPVHSS